MPTNISIHAPRVGSDLHDRDTNPTGEPFQSTLPVWGATASTCSISRQTKFQSTLPVWGATAKLHKYFLKFYRI